jgi:hypothetical protein
MPAATVSAPSPSGGGALDALRVLAGVPGAGAHLVALGPGALPMAWLRRRGGRDRTRATLVAWPSAARPSRLASCDRDVLAAMVGGRRRAAVAVRLPGAAAAARLAPTVLVTTPRASAAPLPLERLLPEADLRRLGIRPSTGHAGVAAVWATRGRKAFAWVKVGDVDAEAAALRAAQRTAVTTAVRVPAVLGCDGGMLATGALEGTRVEHLLAGNPADAGAVCRAIVCWLAEWGRRSRVEREISAGDLEAWLLAPARRLADCLDAGYPAWLASTFASLAGRRATLAAAHRDLTMFNVLRDGPRYAVLDWEAATAQAPPFLDAPYAIVDAVAACDGYRDRPASFERCFGSSAAAARALAADLLEPVRAGEGDPLLRSAAFHACWLGHAVNDLARRGPGGAFVEIARRLSADPVGLDPFGGG